MDVVPINIKNDDSVQRVIDKTAQKLQNKYSKKRNINEKILKHRSKFLEIVSRILSVICIAIVIFSVLLFAGIINSFVQGVPSSFAGFSSMKVGSSSMVASGFKKGDNVIAKSVNTKTLKEGCIIAFYNDRDVSEMFDVTAKRVDTKDIGDPEYQITFAKFFGTQNDAIKSASKKNRDIIFHKIYEVYEIDGVRWFRTYGSSNFNSDGTQQIDNWYVREDLVLGLYDNSFVAKNITWVLQLFSSSQGIIFALVIPLVLFGIIIFLQFLREIQVLKLQLDVVEEKRKIDDPICVKYQVGYRMDDKMKYKVLAQANDENKNEYISFLWKDGKASENIRKYCLRKKLYLKPVERLLEVNRICQERLSNGEDPSKVAKFYLEEKEKLQKEQLDYERKFRKWVKEDKKKKVNLGGGEDEQKEDVKQDEQVVIKVDSDEKNVAENVVEETLNVEEQVVDETKVDTKKSSNTKSKAKKTNASNQKEKSTKGTSTQKTQKKTGTKKKNSTNKNITKTKKTSLKTTKEVKDVKE